MLGTAGLPHILIRFFTVRDRWAVRTTVLTSTWMVGLFYLMVPILGMGAIALVGWHAFQTVDPTGNMTILLLAGAVGGDFFTAFVAACAFATVLAVVTGLLLAATSTFVHDVFNHGLNRGLAAERPQLRTARWTAAVIGALAIGLSLEMRHMNVASVVSLAFVVAASTNLPLLLFTLYWRRFNRVGAIAGVICGLASSMVFVLWNLQVVHFSAGKAASFLALHLQDPGLFAIPCGFLGAVLGTWLGRPHPDDGERFTRVLLQSHTGISPDGW
ncbi:hypothetical protein GCM10025857_24550 [Alicyclobacillus contaminans]|nr:hypothetical protein GCM10025857_24550 [Alicyclobacillus contaminans]